MGRKRRIARRLEISRAKKALESLGTLGAVLTSEEYSALEREALKSPIERDLEEFEGMVLRELEASLSPQELEEVEVVEEVEFFLGKEPKPLPEEIVVGSPQLTRLDRVMSAWAGGLIIADGHFGTTTYKEIYYPYVVVKMTDRETIEKLAYLFKVSVGRAGLTRTGKMAWRARRVGKGMLEVYEKTKPYLSTIKIEQAERAIRTAMEHRWLHATIFRERKKNEIVGIIEKHPEGITTTEILGAYPHETGITLPYKTLAKYLTELHREGRIRAEKMTGYLEDGRPYRLYRWFPA